MGSYVSSHLQGGLGNYLFQIAAAFGVSKRDNKELKIDSNSGKLDFTGIKSGNYSVYYEVKEVSCLLGKKDSTQITLLSSGQPLPSFSFPSPICLLSSTTLDSRAISGSPAGSRLISSCALPMR